MPTKPESTDTTVVCTRTYRAADAAYIAYAADVLLDAARRLRHAEAYPRLIEALRFEMERYIDEGEYKRSEPIRDILRELGEL